MTPSGGKKPVSKHWKVDERLSNFKDAVKLASHENSTGVEERSNKSPFHARHQLRNTPTQTPIEKLNDVLLSNNKRSVTPTGTTTISKFTTPNHNKTRVSA